MCVSAERRSAWSACFPETCCRCSRGQQIVWFELDMDAMEGPDFPMSGPTKFPYIPDRGWISPSSRHRGRHMPLWTNIYARLASDPEEGALPLPYDGKGLPEGMVSYTSDSGSD